MPLFNIGFVIFRDVTQLDFTGPLQVLSRLPQSTIHIIAKSAALRTCARADAQLFELSASRLDLHAGRKRGRCRYYQ